ncbi:LOW QUALITY PROTEIN: thyrotropin releasing hormone [Budorcas taxicolor]|uniref:LOW QUALITY PROTEIN: thyrotropin releasing hormone n=1 Tax=Budorcas taxicolor TaxID=37181 RepID=UPI00228483C6|nr:LOW QUALITY PROTEIN: thyrotropin releasing hormone [Budorcas taxicolor]
MELLNCIDGGAVAKASFVRAVWSQPCLAERYIHYADSSERDFQRDGPRRETSSHAPFPGLSRPLVPRLIAMRAHSVKGAVLIASQISAHNSPFFLSMFLAQLCPSHLGHNLDLPGQRLTEFADSQFADSTGQWEEVVMDKPPTPPHLDGFSGVVCSDLSVRLSASVSISESVLCASLCDSLSISAFVPYPAGCSLRHQTFEAGCRNHPAPASDSAARASSPGSSPAAPAAPAPDFRRSRQAGGPAGGVPTGPAAVSVPSRRPRPLRADLTRTAASRRYKQRPGGEEGNRRPGSYQRSSTPDPQTPDPESPDRSPGSRTGPRSSCRADAKMPGPWFLLAMALTLTLTSVPGGLAQLDVAQQDVDLSEQQGLEDLLRQAERLLLLREDLQRLPEDQDDSVSESQIFQPDWFSKRQHPGKREEEEADEGVEGEEEEGGAVGLRKRQHPGRRDDVAAWAVDVGQQKRQHPGRRASWLGYAVTKRQHPGRRLVDPRPQRSWEEAGEDEDEGGELMSEKRQHPGKRALGSSCGPRGPCGQASLLLGLLADLSRGQGAEEKRQHPGRRAAWASEPLEE